MIYIVMKESSNCQANDDLLGLGALTVIPVIK
jgi:hypothetical protein